MPDGYKKIHCLARLGVAFVMFYHGLVPKWLTHQHDELLPLLRMGLSNETSTLLMQVCGAMEMLFAVLVVVCWRMAWPFYLTAGGMVVALIGVAFTAPELLTKAFNVVTTNSMLLLLALIGAISLKHSGARN